jgi:DNA primase
MPRFYDAEKLNELDILSVASALGIPVRRNKTLCFMHNENTPSLIFFPKNNTWYCFGCRVGGNVINLVMKKQQLGFMDACMWLERNFATANMQPSYTPRKRSQTVINNKLTSEACTEPDHVLYSEIVDYLKLSEQAKQYLCTNRALSQDVVKAHSIVSLDDPKAFNTWLIQNYEKDRLIKAGLLREHGEGEPSQIWHKHGIVFPYINRNKQIANMQLRPCKIERGPKYIFLSGVETCLYNENRLACLPHGKEVFLCEGVIDTLSMITAGYEAVGLPGAGTLKDEWLRMLAPFNINIVLDSDETGRMSARAVKTELEARNINVQLLYLGEYNDVNEMLVRERGMQK